MKKALKAKGIERLENTSFAAALGGAEPDPGAAPNAWHPPPCGESHACCSAGATLSLDRVGAIAAH